MARGRSAEGRVVLRRLAPNAVTALRPVLGALCGLAAYQGHGARATWLYLLGFLTDVTDGLLARTLKVASASGRKLDGKADVAFGALVGAGLAGRAVRERDLAVLLVLGVVLFGIVLSRVWIRSHWFLGKALASLCLIVWFALLWVTVPQQDRPFLLTAGLLIGVATYTYEGLVMWRELESGSRRIR